MRKRSFPLTLAPSGADASRLGDRLFCVPIGIIGAIAIMLRFGLSWWSAVAIVFLIACPTIVAWAFLAERGLPEPWGRKR
jgi:hypothetical protein